MLSHRAEIERARSELDQEVAYKKEEEARIRELEKRLQTQKEEIRRKQVSVCMFCVYVYVCVYIPVCV